MRYVLSDDDVRVLRELVVDRRNRVQNTQDRPAVPEEQGTAPEVYVAKTVLAIPAISSSRASYQPCNIYRLRKDAFGVAPTDQFELIGKQLDVYNIGSSAVDADSWVLVARDKFGSWVATPTGAGGSTTITSDDGSISVVGTDLSVRFPNIDVATTASSTDTSPITFLNVPIVEDGIIEALRFEVRAWFTAGAVGGLTILLASSSPLLGGPAIGPYEMILYNNTTSAISKIHTGDFNSTTDLEVAGPTTMFLTISGTLLAWGTGDLEVKFCQKVTNGTPTVVLDGATLSVYAVVGGVERGPMP